MLRAAFAALAATGLGVERQSPVFDTPPLGPSRRRFANAAAVVACDEDPPGLLERLKGIESAFGRKGAGQRWRARVLDIDVILWSGGAWASHDLVIPHVEFRERPFVLAPAAAIAPAWRDPLTGFTLRQLHARLTSPRPLPR